VSQSVAHSASVQRAIAPVSLRLFASDVDAFAQALGRSFARYGFAVIADHGLDQARIDAAAQDAKAFFALPDAVKRRYRIDGISGQRGYTPFGVETAKGAAHFDLKEFWHVGRELPPSHPYRRRMPDNVWPEEVEGFMHAFNIGTVISTAVHEAYPGHYIQFLWVPRAPSRVRKLLGANTDVEGWAHYCEQMMLDQGYGQPGVGAKDERESKFLRLGQLQDALLRNARFIVGIEMHTGKMSFDEAVAFFQKEGYQSKETAMVETKRGTSDPTYLYYTLGKLEIMKLREDMKKKQGAAFSLEEFHNSFLREGFPPIKIVREAMLGDQSPTL